jgi:hypothetical protein
VKFSRLTQILTADALRHSEFEAKIGRIPIPEIADDAWHQTERFKRKYSENFSLKSQTGNVLHALAVRKSTNPSGSRPS